MKKKYSDIVVIGSSPISIFYCIKNSFFNKSITIVEASSDLGGAWSIGSHKIGNKIFFYNKSCHLIEWYLGGYKLLRHISGMDFIILKPQPIKIWNDGSIEAYTSRKSIIINYFYTALNFAKVNLKLFLNLIYFKKNKISNLLIFKNNLHSFFFQTFYCLSGVFFFNGICAPKDGYVKFIKHLLLQLKKKKITILKSKVLAIKKINNSTIKVFLKNNKNIYAKEVIVGESVKLKGITKKNHYYTDYLHVLISVPANDVLTRNPYVHFVDNQILHRMTYLMDTIDINNSKISIFLLQFRIPLFRKVDLLKKLKNIKILFMFFNSIKNLKILKIIKSKNLASTNNSQWNFYDKKEPIVIKTIGDLSRNAILMKKNL
jgi:hypothetical protein